MNRIARKQGKRNLYIAIGAIAVIAVVAIIFWPGAGDSATNNKFIEKAKKDLKDKKAAEALEDLKLVVQNDPDNEEAKKLYNQAKKELYNQAKSNIAKKKYPEAKGQMGILTDAEPNNKQYQDTLNTIPGDTEAKDPSPGNNNDNPGSGGMKAIPDTAIPIDLLPKSMSGYRISQNGWVDEPVKAGSTYLPMDPSLKINVDRVITTIIKFGNSDQASTAFEEQKSALRNSINSSANGHPIVIGYYEFDNSDVPSIASVTWIRGRWYFRFDALPLSKSASNEVKKNTALDVVGKFGY